MEKAIGYFIVILKAIIYFFGLFMGLQGYIFTMLTVFILLQLMEVNEKLKTLKEKADGSKPIINITNKGDLDAIRKASAKADVEDNNLKF